MDHYQIGGEEKKYKCIFLYGKGEIVIVYRLMRIFTIDIE